MNLTDRMDELRAWYRGALRDRIRQLDELTDRLVADDEQVPAEVRAVAYALHGSGGSYGFPAISNGARLLEESDSHDLLPRLLAFTDFLRSVSGTTDEERSPAWPCRILGLKDGLLELPVAPETEGGNPGYASLWHTLSSILGLDEEAIADRIADALGHQRERVDDGTVRSNDGRTARLLVPPGLAQAECFVPIREDGVRLHVATPDPFDLEMLLAVASVTGRQPVAHIATPTAVDRTLELLYGGALPSEPALPSDLRQSGTETLTRVLIVDDDEDARLFPKTLLEREGFEVLEAADGESALELIESGEAIQLMLLDLGLPGIDGREVLKRLREQKTPSPVGVIVVTGSQDLGTEADLIELGADDYLTKPIEPRLFTVRVQATLRRVGAGV